MSRQCVQMGLALLLVASCDSRNPEPTPDQVCERLEKIRKDSGSELAEERDVCVTRQSELRDRDAARWGCSAACPLQANGQDAEIECVSLCWPPPEAAPSAPSGASSTLKDDDLVDSFMEADE